MSFKKREFKSKLNEVNLGINSRIGGETKIKVAQIAWDGTPINKDAVSTQSFIMTSEGKNSVKIRAAYHKDSPLCAYIQNVLSDKVRDRIMPLPLISASKEAKLPEGVVYKDGKIVDFTFVRKDDKTGKVISAAEYRDGSWVKVDYNVPLYKEYFTNTYEPIPDDKRDGKDENGNYILTFNKFCYISQCNIGFFLGHAVDQAGKEIKDSAGVYMVEGDFDEKYFSRLYPQRSGGKVSIANRINKVFAHPQLGVLKDKDIVNGVLVKGTFKYSPKAVTLAVYDESGNVMAILDDRASYKINAFKPKRNNNEISNEASNTAEIIKKVENRNVQSSIDDDIESLLG